MRRSWFSPVGILLLVALGGCASHQPVRPEPPALLTRGSLKVAAALQVVSVELPGGFVVDPGYAPVWLRQGAEIGVAGRGGDHLVMIGVSGERYTNQRILAEDFGSAAPRGKLLDVAPSPDGFALATAVAEPTQGQVEVMLRDTLGQNAPYTLAAIEGSFKTAQLAWIDAFTLVLALRGPPPHPAKTPNRGKASAGGKTSSVTGARAGLYAISAAGPPGIRRLRRIRCALGQLSFSPGGRMVVSQGDDAAPPALINLDDETCHPLKVRKPMRVLGWAPDSSAFLYAASGEGAVPAVFRYDLTSGRTAVVAIASGAAAYASDGTIVALGNNSLTWQRAAAQPDKLLNLHVALSRSDHQEVTIRSIGVATTPDLLARARLIFLGGSDHGVIDIVVLAGEGPQRELLEYSYPARATFALASVELDAPLAISWSPDGKAIAIVDGGVQPNLLTVITPAH